ncbi:hypothetical protein M2341_001080 [Sphingobium sp. B7D2B]|uniref:retron St85 family effector protein n=1 Tax=Sphingobium sp. B7D2B TaxID=2940583 RepID=UPI0022247913|nr:retron St85 family effector protein [Sphingobium sp. B7D2B]MCW2365633.1 hypothetical protein [Sphingobium sp. B7D2B]
MDDLDVGSLHVQAPTEVIFLCGGRYDGPKEDGLKSLRHAFHCISEHPSLKGRDIILAEDVTRRSDFAKYYDNFLLFESDIAQITELVILFCESAGSFAELGSFSSYEEIYRQMLVVIRDIYWEEDSFIKLGPLSFLKKKCGPSSVFVIRDDAIGIKSNYDNKDDISGLNIDKFKEVIQEPLRIRLEITKEPTTFNSSRTGHRIKLIVGLIQEYRALSVNEIVSAMAHFSVDATEAEVRCYLLCAHSVGWIEEKASGFDSYWIPIQENEALNYPVSEQAEERDRTRRRVKILDHWRQKDHNRYRLVVPATQEQDL